MVIVWRVRTVVLNGITPLFSVAISFWSALPACVRRPGQVPRQLIMRYRRAMRLPCQVWLIAILSAEGWRAAWRSARKGVLLVAASYRSPLWPAAARNGLKVDFPRSKSNRSVQAVPFRPPAKTPVQGQRNAYRWATERRRNNYQSYNQQYRMITCAENGGRSPVNHPRPKTASPECWPSTKLLVNWVSREPRLKLRERLVHAIGL